jgi:sporulation integral membrane protein YlbJ
VVRFFKKHLSNLIPAASVIIACVLIVAKSEIASSGAKQSLTLCASVIIPSLFPFMVFSAFVIKSGLYLKIGKIIGRPLGFIFNLPPCVAGAVVMGFVGGYPIGPSMTAGLLKLGAIDEKQSQRLACFNVNAGPAFIIATVGETIYQSKGVGYILFASVILSTLTMGIGLGIFSRIKYGKAKESRVIQKGDNFVNAFVGATENASKSMFSICAWVVTCGIVVAFIRSMPIEKEYLALLCAVTEVTSGCTLASGVLPLQMTAAFISFGGFCIFFQIVANVRKTGIKISLFLFSRFIAAVLAYIYCTLLMRLFPISSHVFSNNIDTLTKNFSISIPTTVCLIITCAFLIFEVDRNKNLC